MTLRETIKKVCDTHLKLGNHLFSQNILGVGALANTIDISSPNLVELQTSDVMNGGVVVGASLFERPIYVIRFQGFSRLNMPFIQSYAAKSKEMSGISCPIFIRAMCVEGLIGPVASNSHHGLVYREPGIKIVSPMTSKEYESIYQDFMNGDDPMYVSEHRKSYDNTEELEDIVYEKPDFVLFPFSVTRFESAKASQKLFKEGIKVSVFHQFWINPLKISELAKISLMASRYGGAVLDDDYPNGIAKQVAYELMLNSKKSVYVLAIEEKSAGFQITQDNLPPDCDKICQFVKEIVL